MGRFLTAILSASIHVTNMHSEQDGLCRLYTPFSAAVGNLKETIAATSLDRLPISANQ